ncbi:MAG: AAA family ATPase [Nocardioides sp.]
MTWQTVTLVFTDLVASTELSSKLGPSQSDLLRKEHFALLRSACAESGGREVKNLGDGVMLAFVSVTAALEAAVAVQRSVAQRNRRSLHPLSIRVGVAVGEVKAEDGDYFGEPVVQAARLCARADGGQILVSDLVRSVAGVSAQVEFGLIGELELKGLPVPVVTHEVRWLPEPGGGLSLPARMRVPREHPHVGRSRESAVLLGSWDAACSGHGQLVLIGGEPGIGKTRLVTDHATAVHAAGGTVLYGSVSDGFGVPYQPWIESLGRVVDGIGAGFLEAYVAAAGPDLVRLLPQLQRRIRGLPAPTRSDGETERYLLMEALTRFMHAVAQRNPVLLVLDDLHWADKPTLLLLAHLHRNLGDSGVQMVATYRDSEHSEHLTETLANLRREQRVERMTLTGLGHEDISELLHNASGQPLTTETLDLCRLLERDTAGNPLFVTEVLRDLREGGFLAPDADGVWGLTSSLHELPSPASVRELVGQRVGKLGAAAHRALTAAAAIGLEFEVDVLAAVLEVSPDHVLELVDEGERATLLTEEGTHPGRARFVHALIAHALLVDLSPTRRSRLHRRIADVILDRHGAHLGDRTGAVATHLLASGDKGPQTLDLLRQAGRRALDALAPDEALRWFVAARNLIDAAGQTDPDLDCDLALETGVALRDAGDPTAHEHLTCAARQAERLNDGARLAAALFAMDRSFATSLGDADQAMQQLMERAIELCPEPGPSRARLLAMLGAELDTVGSLARRRTLVDEALHLARGLNDTLTLARVLVSSVSALLAAETLPQRREIIAELERLTPQVTDPFVRTFTAYHGVYTSIEALDRPGVTRAMADLTQAGAESQPLLTWSRSVMETCVVRLDGDLVEAERRADEAFAYATGAGIHDAFVLYAVQLMDVRIAQGRIGELLEVLVEASDANPSLEGPLRTVIALAQHERGLVAEAHESIDQVLADGVDTIPRTYAWLPALDQLATAANRLGRLDAAAAAHPLVVEVPDVVASSGPTATAHSSTILGVLEATMGDLDAARARFDFAAVRLEQFHAPVLLARNHFEHARAISRLGDIHDRQDLHRLAALAAATYEAHGCPALVTQCRALMTP